MLAQQPQPLAHLAHKPFDRRLRRLQIVPNFNHPRHHMPPLPHRQVARKGNNVSAHINEQHPTQPNVFVNKSNNSPSNQPPTLNTSEQKCIGLYELAFGRQLLNQRRDRRPEHPEARCHQRIHQIKLPHLYPVQKREHHHHQNNDSSHSISPHHQPPPVFAINNHTGERKHQHGGNRLQSRKRPQSHLRMSALQNRPRHSSRIHSTAQHRDHIGRKNESQRTFLQNGAHPSNLT